MSWTKFKQTFEKSTSVIGELTLKGHTLESAFELLTGKKVPDGKAKPTKSDDVPKGAKSDKKD